MILDSCFKEYKMGRLDWLAILLLFIAPIPFVSTKCMAVFSANHMKDGSEQTIQMFSSYICEFRTRQLISTILTIFLFCFSLALTYITSTLALSKVSWLTIISTGLIANAAFDQLAWQTTWNGDSLIDLMNKWYFRIVYSVGILLLFIALLK